MIKGMRKRPKRSKDVLLITNIGGLMVFTHYLGKIERDEANNEGPKAKKGLENGPSIGKAH